MVKVVRIHTPGGPEAMQIEDLDLRKPEPHEVRVKVEAIGLNRAETSFREGQYVAPTEMPTLIGLEGCGVIEEVGSAVQDHAVGDKVCVLPNIRQGRYGLYAEAAVVPQDTLLPWPEGLSAVEAASIWMQCFTALGIIHVGKAGPGDYVLIPAASSSVGVAAMQLANWAGATPIAVSRTLAKSNALMAQGAAHVVASRDNDLVAEVMKITGGKGARLVFDPVGGEYVMTLAQAMAPQGILFQYGGLSGAPTPYPHWPAAMKGLSVRGWIASEIWSHPQHFPHYRALILQGLQEGHLKPVVDRTFSLDQIAEAHRYMESNSQVGKIVVTTG